MAILTLAEVKSLVGVTGTADDLQLAGLLEAAESFVREYTGRDLASQDYTHFFSGDDSPYLVLRQRPVTAVSGVWLDPSGAFGAAPELFSTLSILTRYKEVAW